MLKIHADNFGRKGQSTMHSRTLIFGHDTTLLRTRELILSRAGFDVLTTSDPLEASELLANQPVDLLILCHTLHDPERQSILAVAHIAKPALRVLALVANATASSADGNEATLSIFDGPEKLVTVAHGLTDPGKLSTPTPNCM
jgi:DNA-binding NtrC family response regulator